MKSTDNNTVIGLL